MSSSSPFLKLFCSQFVIPPLSSIFARYKKTAIRIYPKGLGADYKCIDASVFYSL